MKKMGFFGVALATTLSGEVTVAPSAGLETVNGKSFDPGGGGTCAVGAGNRLVDGDQVIGTGGTYGRIGWVGVGFMELVPQLVRSPTLANNSVREKNQDLIGARTAMKETDDAIGIARNLRMIMNPDV